MWILSILSQSLPLIILNINTNCYLICFLILEGILKQRLTNYYNLLFHFYCQYIPSCIIQNTPFLLLALCLTHWLTSHLMLWIHHLSNSLIKQWMKMETKNKSKDIKKETINQLLRNFYSCKLNLFLSPLTLGFLWGKLEWLEVFFCLLLGL